MPLLQGEHMRHGRCSLARQRGRSLLELMIAIAIGLLVLGAMLIVYMGTNRTSQQSTAVTRMNEDAAIALTYLGSNLRMAGFSFPRVNAPATTATVNGIAVGMPDSNFVGAGIRGCDNGFVNPAVAFDALACATAPGAPAAFAVRFEGDTSNTTAIGVNPSDCLSQGVTLATPSAYNPALTYKLIESRFSVSVGGASGTPELFCAGNGSTPAFAKQPVMQYVENLVIEYGIAQTTANRAIVNQYVNAVDVDALGGTVDERWGRVVNLKVCLLMRSEQRDRAGSGSWRDCNGNVQPPAADGLIRRAYNTVYTLRNRADFATAPSSPSSPS